MSTGTHLALAHARTRTRARRVTHRTAFAANNYVRGFFSRYSSSPILSSLHLLHSFPLPFFLSFASASSRVSLRSQRTGLASFERRGGSLARTHARTLVIAHESSFPARARAGRERSVRNIRAADCCRTGSKQERIGGFSATRSQRDAPRGCVDITRASPLSAYLNISCYLSQFFHSSGIGPELVKFNGPTRTGNQE